MCKLRFNKVLAYFRRLEAILKMFEIYAEAPESDGKVAVAMTKKEQGKVRLQSKS